MTFDHDNIGGRIRNARKKLSLTQQELGERLGVSGAMIGQYESGTRNPKIDTVKRIADALSADVNWLLHGYTLGDRDDAMKESVAVRFAEAELQKKAGRLNSDGLKKVIEYIDLLGGSGRYDRQSVVGNSTLTVYGNGPAGSFPSKPEEDD